MPQYEFPGCDTSSGYLLSIVNSVLVFLGYNLLHVEQYLPNLRQVIQALILSVLTFCATKLYQFLYQRFFCK